MPSPWSSRARLTISGFSDGKGFSLVEVTIALGIVAFALISVLGIMPVGLNTMRDAMDQTTEAQIARRISGQATLIPFDQLGDFASAGPYFFTREGTPQKTKESDTRYEVRLKKISASFPGSSNAVDLGSNMATLEIETLRQANSVVVARSTNVVYIPNSGNSKF